MNLDFFKNIEDSLKCNFKYTNMILNNTESTSEEDLAKEERRVKKIANQIAYFADKEPRQLQSPAGEAKITEMLEWFVQLDAPLQKNFLENILREKLRAGQNKTEETIGLLSQREGDSTFYVSGINDETINHLRNVFASHKIKFITNRLG